MDYTVQVIRGTATDIKQTLRGIGIHADDTISVIKQKIIRALEKPAVAAEIYMFVEIAKSLDINTLWEEDDERPAVITQNIPTAAVAGAATHRVFIPLGFHYENDTWTPLIPTNPFLPRSGSGGALTAFENDLLLNYFGEDGAIVGNTIYVCLAEDVAAARGVSDDEWLVYFPILKQKGITTTEEFAAAAHNTLQKEAAAARKNKLIDTIQPYYDLAAAAAGAPEYARRGIRTFRCKIRPKYKINVPLEGIFKILQTSPVVPFIKYNPASRQENLYRLYTERIAKNGKKIPYLAKSHINSLSRKIGKSKQVAVYITVPDMRDLDIHTSVELYVVFEPTGEITIFNEEFDAISAVSIETLEKILKQLVQPIIKQFVDILGLEEHISTDLHFGGGGGGGAMEILQMKYVWLLPFSGDIKRAHVQSLGGCFLSLFEKIVDFDNLKRGHTLKYRRVQNYQEMDGERELITALFQKYERTEDVLMELIQVYKKDPFDARQMVGKYIDTIHLYTDKQGNIKVVENAGFIGFIQSVEIQQKYYIMLEFDNITSLFYLPQMQIYIDGFFRLFLFPKTVPAAVMKQMKDQCKIRAAAAAAPATEPAAPAPAAEPELKKKILQHIIIDSSSSESSSAATVAAAEKLDEPIEIEEENSVSDDASEEFDMDLMGDDASVAGSIDMDLMGDETHGGGGEDAADEDAAAVAAAELEHIKQMKKGESLFDNPIGKRLYHYDPVLFAIPTNKKEFTNFSRACPVVRQPVVLNEQEKEYIDKNHRGAYTTAIRYGSDPQKQHWYICPRYWCVLNNTAMTEDDVRAGKCGNSAKIIPRDAKKIPEDAFVYEFNDYGTEHLDPKTKQYRPHYPGLMKHTKHRISHLKFPCCFKKEQKELLEHLHDSAAAAGPAAAAPEIDANAISYIYDGAKTPVPEGRLAFLPVPIQQYLQTNNGRCVEKNKPFEIKRDTTCIIKAGVEKNSFLGCILKVMHYKYGASARARTIHELQQFLADLITVDDFMAYQNGALVKAFYRAGAGAAAPPPPIDISPETAKLFQKYPRMRDRVLSAHTHFLEFLRDKENFAAIDYTYLWDMITQPNIKLFPDGMNLVILKLPENDPTMNVEVICPTSVYSNTKLFDATKETIIMIKTEAVENRDYYDLISLYHHSSVDNVIKIASVFHPQKIPENIKRVMTYIEYTIGLYCAPRAAPPIEAAPDRIDFVRAPPLSRVLSQLSAAGGEITLKVINSQGNVVGFFVRRGGAAVAAGFVPCAPLTHYSKILPDIRAVFIDDEDLPWLPYRETVDFLKSMSAATGIPCAPVVKVIDGGFIVGVITQTNQFVAIETPVEDLRGDEDGLRAFHNNNTILTEKELYGDTAAETEDPERVKITKYIRLESQFFQAFRRLVRAEIIRGGATAAEIRRVLDDTQTTYKTKLREIDRQLRELMRERVEFVDYKEDVLMKLDIITASCGGTAAHCSPSGRFLVPRKHLIHREVDNRAVYFGRVADELIRYKQLRAFMFQPKTYINTSRVKYNLTRNEIILLQSTVDAKVGNYFDNLMHDKFIISFTRAVPSVAVARDDNYMTVEQQRPFAAAVAATTSPRAPPAAAQEDINANLKHTIDSFDKIIGNNRSEWIKRFPKTCKEIIFKNTAEASFSVVMYILQSIHKKEYMVAEIKQWLVEIYTKKITARDLPVVLYILKTEGKGDIIQKVNSSEITLENAIMSEEYYMTNLDLYALIHYYSREFSTNIILMTALYLKDIFAITNEKINWLLLHRAAASAAFFIRSPTDFKTGVIPTYSLIVPSVEIPEMNLEFQEEYTRAAAPHIYSFEDYLRGRRELIRGAAGKAARAAAAAAEL